MGGPNIFANNIWASTGVLATDPPNLITAGRPPTSQDFNKGPLGTLWLYVQETDGQAAIYILAGLGYLTANWQEISFVGAGNVQFNTNIDSPAYTVGGILNLFGGANITTTASAVNTVTIDLIANPTIAGTLTTTAGNIAITAGNILLPFSNAAGTQGVIEVNGSPVFYIDNNLNTFLGDETGSLGAAVAGSNHCTGIGAGALAHLEGGTDNTAVGFTSSAALTTGNNNTSIGSESLVALINGNNNTAVGIFAAANLNSGNGNIALGRSAGTNWTTNETNNIAIGSAGVAGENSAIRLGTLATQTSCFIQGVYGVAQGGAPEVVTVNAAGQLGVIGASGVLSIPATNLAGTSGVIQQPAGTNLLSSYGFDNLFMGKGSATTANATVTGFSNVYFAPQAGASIPLTSGFNNSCFGCGAGASITTGSYNTLIGNDAGAAINTGDSNTALGDSSLLALTSGNYNTSIGLTSLSQLGTGVFNTCIGYTAGSGFTTNESSNIIIGYNAQGFVATNNQLVIGAGSGAGDGEIAPGNAYIFGIYDAGIPAANPVYVTAGGNIGTAVSSKKYKENIKDLDVSVSEPLLKLRPVSYTLKKYPKDGEQIGLIAEEVHELLPKLVNYQDGLPQSVRYNDIPVLLIAELQKMSKRLAALEAKEAK
jgi:hypothetical protein